MLFNVFYKKEYLPLLQEVDYIINETTKEQLTLEQFVKNINSYDEVNYISNMQVFFPFLEDELARQNFECKHTNSKNFSHYTPSLKPKTYVADIYSKSSTYEVRFVNKMRIGAASGQKYFINFNPFTVYQEINTNFTDEEIAHADYLSKIGCKSTTPAGAMRDEYGIRKLQTKIIRKDFAIAMRETIVNPAIIEAYYPGYHKEGWAYDVNSMYPAMMKKIEHLPDPLRAKQVKETTIVPPNCFGWRRKDYNKWDVVFEGEQIEKNDWLLPCFVAENPYIKTVDKMYRHKQSSKKLGGCAYRFFKQKVNSFIGSFAQKNRRLEHFTYWYDKKGRKEPIETDVPRYDIFSIITALARRYITELMDKARAAGCRVLQVNTDGFITDKPLPESMLGEGLGELRFDRHLTNLYIFSPNQYVADGVQCISGLPDGMYRPGQTQYTYNKIMWSNTEQCFRLIETNIDLMSELKMNFVELEDVIKYEH